MALKIILSLLLIIGLYIGVRAILEPFRPDFTIVKLGNNIGNNNSDSKASLNALLFSDFHFPLNRIPIEYIVNNAVNHSVDCVLFAGDMVSHAKDLPEGILLFNRLNSLLAVYNIPLITILGNHDYGLKKEHLDFPLLVNEYFVLEDQNKNAWKIVGLDDIRMGKIENDFSRIKAHSSSVRAEDINTDRTITLAHNPDSILYLDAKDSKFCLSGHFHGGQIKLFGLEYMLLRKEVLCRTGHIAGHHQIKGMHHYISRGLGNVLFPFRLGVKPELSLLQFYAEDRTLDTSEEDEKIKSYIAKNGLFYK